MSREAVNKIMFALDNYAHTEVHNYLAQLIKVLEYRRNVARKLCSQIDNGEFAALLEHCNNQILQILNIPTNE